MSEDEQRSSRRLQAVGSVFLRLDGREIECVPLDVSIGGARVAVVGDRKRVPWVGAAVHVDFMRRRGLPAFSLEAMVVRSQEDGSDVGLRFEARGAAEDALHAFLTDEAERLGIPVTSVGLPAPAPPWTEPEARPVRGPAPEEPITWALLAGTVLLIGLLLAAWKLLA